MPPSSSTAHRAAGPRSRRRRLYGPGDSGYLHRRVRAVRELFHRGHRRGLEVGGVERARRLRRINRRSLADAALGHGAQAQRRLEPARQRQSDLFLGPAGAAYPGAYRARSAVGRRKPDLGTHRDGRDRRNPRCAPVAARLAAAMAAARPVARRRPWWPATPERRRQVKRRFPHTITAWSGFHHPCQKCARQRPRSLALARATRLTCQPGQLASGGPISRN